MVENKPSMNYILTVLRQYNNYGSEEVISKVRSKGINRAVDTAEIIRYTN